jgi:hypothetical protein
MCVCGAVCWHAPTLSPVCVKIFGIRFFPGEGELSPPPPFNTTGSLHGPYTSRPHAADTP